MRYQRLSASTQKSEGIRLYESALLIRRMDYWRHINQLQSAIGSLEEDLPAANPGERRGLLERLYDCHQRVWVGAMIADDGSAEEYGKRTLEIARELGRLD